jgi:predicted MPP superfamily phosphohydrolase
MMNNKFHTILLILCCVFLLHSAEAQSNLNSVQPHIEFALISDTQSPMWFETLVAARNQNEIGTRMLLDSILSDSSLSAVVHFGDVTESSAKDKSWLPIDSFLAKAKKRSLSVYAAIGNHDYFFSAKKGEENFRKRFPMYRRTGYTVKIGDIAFVLLNSNFGRLADSERTSQQTWYAAEMDSLEADSSVVTVIVGCHHPPYTNNSLFSGSDEVRKEFVPLYLSHKKAKLFLSGHTHAFEHFKIKNKDFLVLGGGGGLQHTLYLGKEQKEHDHFPDQTLKRMFHYIRCSADSDSLRLSVMMIKTDFSGISSAYKFSIAR